MGNLNDKKDADTSDQNEGAIPVDALDADPFTNAYLGNRPLTRLKLLLWRALRSGRTADLPMRRQHYLGPYYFEMVCLEPKLAIELSDDLARPHDELQSEYLDALGYRPLRYSTQEFLVDPARILENIRNELLTEARKLIS